MLRRCLDLFYEGCGFAAVLLMVLGIAGLMIFQVLGREFGLLIPGADDIVAYSTAGAAFLGLAHTFRQGELIRVSLLLDAVRPEWRRALEIVALGVSALMVGFIAWYSILSVIETREFGEMAQGLLAIPLWIPQSAMALGATALFLAIVEDWLRVLRGLRPINEIVAEERRARGEFVGEV